MLSSKWWNNKANDIKLVYLYSNIKMMHGPIKAFIKFKVSHTHALNCNIHLQYTNECTYVKFIYYVLSNHQRISVVFTTTNRVSGFNYIAVFFPLQSYNNVYSARLLCVTSTSDLHCLNCISLISFSINYSQFFIL